MDGSDNDAWIAEANISALKISLCLLEGPYDPKTATPMKTSLKNKLPVAAGNFFAIIRSHLVT